MIYLPSLSSTASAIKRVKKKGDWRLLHSKIGLLETILIIVGGNKLARVL
jgi:hypothetical protein